jgi:p-cumate 2,3-dioxygenase alpha subunit
MRANWKLLVENSMDGYHAAFAHERFFTHFMPAMGLQGRTRMPLDGGPSPSPISPTIPLGNGHVTTGYPSSGRVGQGHDYLEKYASEEMEKYREMLFRRHGPDEGRKIEQGAGNYLIFPNLIIIDGWRVFRTFYPSSPDYMEINGWACMPKEDSPELRKVRLEWYLGFQGPGGFATPDDVEALEGCQMGFATHKEVEWSDISRGMKGITTGGPSELQMRVFWREWHSRLTTGKHAAEYGD